MYDGTILMARVPARAADWPRQARNWACFAFVASLCTAVLMGCSLQFARVDGQSMAPTLANEDRLVVDKLAYRLGNPTPGDIVMFRAPTAPGQFFVKRIVAAAGDDVRIRDGRVYVNALVLPDAQVPPIFRSHEDWGPYRVPTGAYMVLGDHRNNSSDSRHWGPVTREAIVGKVHARWWPLASVAIF